MPPILIFQGTNDYLLSYSQGVVFVAKLKEYNVPCQFITKEDAVHGWKYITSDDQEMINWFKKYQQKVGIIILKLTNG